MARTVQNLIDSVLEYGFAKAKYSTSVARWLDEGQRMVFRRAKLVVGEQVQAYTTEVGVNSYPLPSNFASIVFVGGVGYNLISVDTAKEFNELVETSGEPGMYQLDQNKIELWPTPDSEYLLELRYRAIPSSIVEATSSSPAIAEDYYNLLEEYALSKAFSRENDREESEYHMGLFEKGLIEFTGQMDHIRDDTPDQVPGVVEPF